MTLPPEFNEILLCASIYLNVFFSILQSFESYTARIDLESRRIDTGRIKTLDVISRTSVMKFKDTLLNVPHIADELGVDAIVEGSVTRADGRIRVIAQLVDARDHHIWGENYEYENQNILRLQRDIAQAIAREIGARVETQPSENPPSIVNPKAHEALLRGHYVLRNRTEEAFRRALEFFNQAVSIDPDCAPAYASLADTYNLLANYGFVPSPEVRPLARDMAEKALNLDADLAEAHLALAVVAGEYDWDFEEADREFAIALALRPSSPAIRSRHAQLLVALGALAHALARSGDQARATTILDGLLEKQRTGYVSPIGLAVASFGLGRVDEGFGWLERAFDERKGWLLHLRVEPALDDLRDDPRYLDLIERIGLPDPKAVSTTD